MRLSLSSTACLEVVGVETHHAHVRTLFQVEAEERRAAIAAKKKRPGTNQCRRSGSWRRLVPSLRNPTERDLSAGRPFHRHAAFRHVAEPNLILRATVGSTAHGLHLAGTDQPHRPAASPEPIDLDPIPRARYEQKSCAGSLRPRSCLGRWVSAWAG